MPDGFPIIKIDGRIVEPATVLIRKIADAIGGGFKPRQIRRVAQAQADAEVIRTKAQIEISELQQRALTRFVSEESKKQENIESITEKAIAQLDVSSTPQDIDDDWITNFFDKFRIISDEEMQLLWSKILAGEANSPGTFSKRTVNSLGSLDKGDAELFNALCCFVCIFENRPIPMVFHLNLPKTIDRRIYEENGIDFETLLHLRAIGLISFEAVGYFQTELKQQVDISYFDTTLRLKFEKSENNKCKCGNVLLTNVGEELAEVCSSKPIDGFTDFLIELFSKFGYVVSLLNPRQDM